MLCRWPRSSRALEAASIRSRSALARELGAVGLVLTCTLCLCQTVGAQPADGTRAAELEAARRAKAEAIAQEPKPGKIESAINYIEDSRLFPRLFNPPRGWFAQVGGVSEGNGFTLGGGYRVPTQAGTVTMRALGSIRESYLGQVEFTRNFLPRDAAFLTANVTRRHEAAQRFYGTGPDTNDADRTSFGLSATQIEANAGLRVTSWLTTSAGLGYLNPDVTQASEIRRVPDTAAVFTDLEAPGLALQPRFLVSQASVVVDTRKTLNPRRGGLYTVQVRRFDDRDGSAYDFTDTRVDVQQFIPFWNETRVLAVRVLAAHADGLGQSQVPFYLMPTLGGARLLRGYDRQRFRDRSLLLVSAEYRYEVNPFLMAALFYDAGQVAPDWTDFRLKDMQDAWGIGFRFGYSNAVALRSDVVFGGEDPVRLIIGFTTSF